MSSRPVSPSFCPNSPIYVPKSPSYALNSPGYVPSSPTLAPPQNNIWEDLNLENDLERLSSIISSLTQPDEEKQQSQDLFTPFVSTQAPIIHPFAQVKRVKFTRPFYAVHKQYIRDVFCRIQYKKFLDSQQIHEQTITQKQPDLNYHKIKTDRPHTTTHRTALLPYLPYVVRKERKKPETLRLIEQREGAKERLKMSMSQIKGYKKLEKKIVRPLQE